MKNPAGNVRDREGSTDFSFGRFVVRDRSSVTGGCRQYRAIVFDTDAIINLIFNHLPLVTTTLGKKKYAK